MSKPLIFEGAGWEKADTAGDVGNCRIRTRIKNDKGNIIYLEMMSGWNGKKGPDRNNNIAHVSYCHERDCNEQSEWRKWEGNRGFIWNSSNILEWVNRHLHCSFTELLTVNDGSIEVHATKEPLC